MTSNSQDVITLSIVLNALKQTGILTEKSWETIDMRIVNGFVIYSWGMEEIGGYEQGYEFYLRFGEIINGNYILLFNCFLQDTINNSELEKQFGDAIHNETLKYEGVNVILKDISYNHLKGLVIEIPVANAQTILPQIIMNLRTCLYDVRDKYYKSRGV